MSSLRKMPPSAVAVVGMAGRFPGARNVDEFWSNLRRGVESLETFSDAELEAIGIAPALLANPNYVKAGTTLERAAEFDAAFFGVNPREAEVMDPQHRIFLECAWEAIEDAGYDVDRVDVPVGVFAGATMNSYVFANLLANTDAVAAVGAYQAMIGNDKDFLATRVSYKLNLRGPSFTVQTACSTSLVAVHVACESLLTQQCDMALAGGVSLSFPQRSGYLYQEGMITSPDAKVRPFDAKGRGIRSGEGVGLVVLKRLEDAIADGDTIRAVILGTAINNDGAQKIGYTAPSVEGQAEAIATAQSIAGVTPESITYIEAHGTSTPLGDPIEIAALTKVFRAQTNEREFCGIGSVKSNIGHLDAAAGIAGLIKTVLALEHHELPPSLNFETPNPQIDFANSPFFVNSTLRPWNPAGPRRAGVSSFGIGGTNAHAVLEEWPATETASGGLAPDPVAEHAIVLSARTAEALDSARVRLAAFLEQRPEINLANLAFTLQTGRRVFEHRAIFFARDTGGALSVLRENRVAGRSQGPVGQRSVTFMFSGQGSQYPGMGASLYASEPVFRSALDRCAEILEPHLNLDLRGVLFPDHARDKGLPVSAPDALNETRLTQPALFTIEYALARLWEHWGVTPQAMIGHSIGEYVAACLAGVFSLDAALELVAARAALMQKAEPGAMLAVQLDESQIAPHLRDGLAIAALNAPGACVVSGPSSAVDGLERALEGAGIICRRLRTSHAFHSPMMQPVVEPFVAVVARHALRPPTLPFISNVTGTWITPQQATDPAYWGQHLRGAVRFADGIRTLAREPGRLMIEVGPGETLKTLALQSLGAPADDGVLSSLPHPLDKQPADSYLRRALARAWLAGAPVRWSSLYFRRKPRRIPLPTYPFESRRFWVEPLARSAAEVPTNAKGSASRGATELRRSATEDWYWLPSWQRGEPLMTRRASSAPGRWLVFTDDSAPASALRESLQQLGIDVVSVYCGEGFSARPGGFSIRPTHAEDYRRLVGTARYDAVLHGWNASGAEAGPIDAARGRAGFYSILYLAQAFGDTTLPGPLPVLVVSTDMHNVMGHEPIRVERSLLIGPVFVMPQDIHALRARSIDLSSSEWSEEHAGGLAQALLSEAAAHRGPSLVAYRNGWRWEQTMHPVRLDSTAASPALRERGVYLITGGTGGLGLAIARDLARRERARLVLVSRSGGNSASWQQTQRELEAEGAEVLVLAADSADPVRMREVIAESVRRFGSLNGVIHAAGVPGQGILQRKTPEGVEPVLRPKVEGTLVLDEVLAGMNLDFLALFSTMNTAFGWHGTTDYSSANAFLDAFAQSGQARSTARVVTINWGAWRDVGMAAAYDAESAAQPGEALRDAISPEEGVAALRHVLASGFSQLYVTPTPMPDLIAAVQTATAQIQASHVEAAVAASATAARPGSNGAGRHPRPMLETPFVAPRDSHEQTLASIWADLLGIEPIGADDNFFDLGGHSLLATRVLSRAQEAFKVGLSLRVIFEAPTIALMVERVREAEAGRSQGALEQIEEREEIEF